MNEKEKDNLIKLLSGIILVLVIGFGGYYIYVTQSRISKLEKETVAKNEKKEIVVIEENVKSKNETEKNVVSQNNEKYEIRNGYKYLKDTGSDTKYRFKTTGWAERILGSGGVNSDYFPSAYNDYCLLVSEIEKVDRGMVPGSNRTFEEATYQEVEDAYKDHLREISQMRQIFDLINGNDDDFENVSGCHYKGTRWNSANKKFKAGEFKSDYINKLWYN